MKPWKCSKKKWCKTLADRLQIKNAHGKGLAPFVLMSMTTGKDTVYGVVYKTDAKDDGVLLNVCPWCAEKICFVPKKKVIK